MKNNIVKKRYWTFVLYPESAPNEWEERLQLTGLPIAISPLHDSDINPDGEPKKAHYHIILCYPGPTTYNCVFNLVSSLNQPIPMYIDSVRGLYRYFTHQDNPEKFQYDSKKIICLNGFSISDYVELTSSEVSLIRKSIQKIIIEYNFIEYSDLLDYLLYNEDSSFYDIATQNTILFNSYLKSRKYRNIDTKGNSKND